MNIFRTTVINIETRFILEEQEIAAGTRPVKPIKLENGSIDTLELAKYEDFVANIFGYVGSHNFKNVDYEYSPHSDTSHYIWFYPTNKDGSIADRYLIKFRISDHEIQPRRFPNGTVDKKRTAERDKAAREYNQQKANELKYPKSKPGNQKYKMYQIIVNNETFDDYDDAEAYVDQILDRIESKYTDR